MLVVEAGIRSEKKKVCSHTLEDGLPNLVDLKFARNLLDRTRLRNIRSNTGLTGKTAISKTAEISIANAIKYDPLLKTLVGGDPEFTAALKHLLVRFEDLCRRNNVTLPSSGARTKVYQLLAIELAGNESLLEMPPRKLVRATLLNNDLVGNILKEREYRYFWDHKYMVRFAVENNPRNPRGFLERVRQNMTDIFQDPALAVFQSQESLVRRAVIHHSKDPKGFLLKAVEDAKQLSRAIEFAELQSMPWIFVHVAVFRPRTASTFLRSAKKKAFEILREDEFEHFRSTPGVVWRAVLSYPKQSRAYLRRVKSVEADIMKNKALYAYRFFPGTIRLAAQSHGNGAEKFLLNRLKYARGFLIDPALSLFHDAPGIILNLLVRGSPAWARKTLSKISEAVHKILEMEEFGCLQDRELWVRRIVMRNVEDPIAAMRKNLLRLNDILSNPNFRSIYPHAETLTVILGERPTISNRDLQRAITFAKSIGSRDEFETVDFGIILYATAIEKKNALPYLRSILDPLSKSRRRRIKAQEIVDWEPQGVAIAI